METITLTKDELLHIVKLEVSKKLNEKNTLDPKRIFNDIKLDGVDLYFINKKYEIVKNILLKSNGNIDVPITLKKHGRTNKNNTKLLPSEVHDQIRKVSLAVFGISLNSELTEQEFNEIQHVYNEFKKLYLLLYEERISNLKQKDFHL
ncbi:hypothetical protein ACFP67_13935 [Mammaliicoccus sciuri]|uniref:hypothetical protein n=1 Tax=Mammaliicoccus sciuri TaxID=1296 RepID=UPI000CD2D216|nr:hypothetical protein [Mammaliicoccus sciuri]PNZ30030.1 hypothetical protein CD114_01370 [Mammaliicoccus sciuri]